MATRLTAAYIDTSLLIHARFEDVGRRTARRIEAYDRLFSAELLLAEMMAFGRRESVEPSLIFDAVKGISWILPERPLAGELARIIEQGYLRGADLWHLACACYLSPVPERVAFLTRDSLQHQVAYRLGFHTPAFT